MTLTKGDQLREVLQGDAYEVEEVTPYFAHGDPSRTGTAELYVVALLRVEGRVAVPVEEPPPTAADEPVDVPSASAEGSFGGGGQPTTPDEGNPTVEVPPPNPVPATA